MGHYIVANGYSTGEVTPTTGFGGEALELNDVAVCRQYAGDAGVLVVQQVGNTAPLSQPAFAVREK